MIIIINSRLSVAIHILSLIASFPRDEVTSEFIAGSVNTNPVVIRRMIGLLKKAGIITSQVGVPGASLTKDSSEITLLDIYKAIQNRDELFAIHDYPNLKCPIGSKIQSTLDATYLSVQKAMEDELDSHSLKDVIKHLYE